jgi:hypothetical protein
MREGGREKNREGGRQTDMRGRILCAPGEDCAALREPQFRGPRTEAHLE